MNVGALAFAFLVFGAFKFMLLTDTAACVNEDEPGCINVPDMTFPNFDVPFDFSWDPQFRNFSDCEWWDFTCSAVADNVATATNNIAISIKEGFQFLAEVVSWTVKQIINVFDLTILLISVLIFFGSLVFSGVPEAPWYINMVMICVPIAAIFLIINTIQGAGSD